MSKFCANCGNQLDDQMNFCGKCGTPVKQESASYFDGPPTAMPIQDDVVLSGEESIKFTALTEFAEGVKKKKNLSYKLTTLGSTLASVLAFLPLLLNYLHFLDVNINFVSYMDTMYVTILLFVIASILPFVDFLIDILSKRKINAYLKNNGIDYGKYLRYAEKYLTVKADTLLFLSTSAVIKQDIEGRNAHITFLILTIVNVLMIFPTEMFFYLIIKYGFSQKYYIGGVIFIIVSSVLSFVTKKFKKKVDNRVSEWENVMKENSILGK